VRTGQLLGWRAKRRFASGGYRVAAEGRGKKVRRKKKRKWSFTRQKAEKEGRGWKAPKSP